MKYPKIQFITQEEEKEIFDRPRSGPIEVIPPDLLDEHSRMMGLAGSRGSENEVHFIPISSRGSIKRFIEWVKKEFVKERLVTAEDMVLYGIGSAFQGKHCENGGMSYYHYWDGDKIGQLFEQCYCGASRGPALNDGKFEDAVWSK